MITLDNIKGVVESVKAGRCPVIVMVDYLYTTYEEILNHNLGKVPTKEELIAMEQEAVCKFFSDLEEFAEEFFGAADFNGLFGGSLHVCETEEDLKEITGVDFTWAKAHEGHWPNVTDLPMSWDHVGYVNDDKATGWAVFLLCTNNAGGPIYFVPESLFDKARVEEHITCHTEAWKGVEFVGK